MSERSPVRERPEQKTEVGSAFVYMNLGEILGSQQALKENMNNVYHLFARAPWNVLEKGVQEIVIISPVKIDPDFIDYFEEAFGVHIIIKIGDLQSLDLVKLTGEFDPYDSPRKIINLSVYTQDLPSDDLINLKMGRIGLSTEHLSLIKLPKESYELVRAYLPKGLKESHLLGVANIMNDKGIFMRLCIESGIPIVSGTEVLDIFDDSRLHDSASQIINRLKNENKLFIRASKAGGGMGNLAVKLENGKYFIDKKMYNSENEFKQELVNIFQKWQKNQSLSVVVAKFFDNIPDGPSVYAEIYKTGNPDNPDEVKIKILGTFAQSLDPKSGTCVGMKRPNDLGFDDELVEIIQKYGEFVAMLGYVGMFNIDSANLDGQLAIIESNGRQTAANPICQISKEGDFAQNFDHVPVHKNYENLTEIIRDLKKLGIPIFGWKKNYSKYGVAPLTGMNTLKTKNGKFAGEIGIIGTSNNKIELDYWMEIAQFMITNGFGAALAKKLKNNF